MAFTSTDATKPTAAEVTQKPDAKPAAAEKAAPAADKGSTATYDKGEAKKISVKTTGEFQLFDVVTNTHFAAGEATEVYDNNQFVIANLANGKLAKA